MSTYCRGGFRSTDAALLLGHRVWLKEQDGTTWTGTIMSVYSNMFDLHDEMYGLVTIHYGRVAEVDDHGREF